MPVISVWFHPGELVALDKLVNLTGLTRSRVIRVAVGMADNLGVTPERVQRYAKERRGRKRAANDEQVSQGGSPESGE